MLSNPHNLKRNNDGVSAAGAERRFGIRVGLVDSDPFSQLVPDDWATWHWYLTENERDTALAEKQRRHQYSRIGDAPTVRYEPVDR